MNGVRTLSIVNEIGNQLTDVLIIPLYQKSFVIAFGPDGKGFQSETRVVITRLFVFNSGENLLPKKLESKGLSLGPVYIGSSNYVNKWLLVKKGYCPKLIGLSDIYSEAPIVLKHTDDNTQNLEIINTLITPEEHQRLLRGLFQFDGPQEDHIKVSLGQEDLVLLEALK